MTGKPKSKVKDKTELLVTLDEDLDEIAALLQEQRQIEARLKELKARTKTALLLNEIRVTETELCKASIYSYPRYSKPDTISWAMLHPMFIDKKLNVVELGKALKIDPTDTNQNNLIRRKAAYETVKLLDCNEVVTLKVGSK